MMKRALAINLGQEYKFGGQGVETVFPNFASFFQNIIFNVITVVGLIFIVLLIFGGFNIIMGAGGANSKKVEEGKKALSAALIGLVVVVFSYFIIQLVEVITGAQILNPTF